MKTKLIKKIGASLMFPALALSLLLFSPRLLSNVDNNETNIVEQDTTLQDSPIIIIVGKVVDLDHQPLEGVVVKDNNYDIEILTNGEGKFELSLDKATVVSFTKMGFYKVDHKVIKSDSNLVVILTPESNQLIVKGYNSPTVKDDEAGLFDLDTISTLKMKYDLMKDSIDTQTMKMDKWRDRMDSTHMKKESHMHMHDSMKILKKDMWKNDMKHDMDTTKAHKSLNYFKNDSLK